MLATSIPIALRQARGFSPKKGAARLSVNNFDFAPGLLSRISYVTSKLLYGKYRLPRQSGLLLLMGLAKPDGVMVSSYRPASHSARPCAISNLAETLPKSDGQPTSGKAHFRGELPERW